MMLDFAWLVDWDWTEWLQNNYAKGQSCPTYDARADEASSKSGTSMHKIRKKQERSPELVAAPLRHQVPKVHFS
jgi:hypothetical protein